LCFVSIQIGQTQRPFLLAAFDQPFGWNWELDYTV